MNFRGVGASDGVFDEGRGEARGLAALWRKRCARASATCRLALAGFSFGAFVQSRVAELLQPQRLVLVAPAVGRFPVAHGPRRTRSSFTAKRTTSCRCADVLDWARPQSLPVVVLPGSRTLLPRQAGRARADPAAILRLLMLS